MRNALLLILQMILGLGLSTGCQDDAEDAGDTGSSSCNKITGPDLPTGTTWQWQLLEAIDTSVDVAVYDIDLFDASQSVIEELHDDCRFVICYFSAGTFEDWRPDANDFPADLIGNPLDEWEGENWLDIRSDAVREIMENRLDLAVLKKCDGVEPDNMDGYQNEPGFDLTPADQLDFNIFIAAEAHERGLSVGLKNDLDQIEQLEPHYNWALNEECYHYNECEKYKPFINAGKAVFHTEYVEQQADGQILADEMCGDEAISGFSSLVKEWDLTAWFIDC